MICKHASPIYPQLETLLKFSATDKNLDNTLYTESQVKHTSDKTKHLTLHLDTISMVHM